MEIHPDGTLFAGGTFGDRADCWPGGVKRVNVDTGERILPDITGSLEATAPTKFRFVRPQSPSLDDEGNIYFSTRSCRNSLFDEDSPFGEFTRSCGVWKIENGANGAFLAVESLDTKGTAVTSDDEVLWRDGRGTAFVTNGSLAGTLLMATEAFLTPVFEGVFMADVSSATLGSPVIPTEFIVPDSLEPEVFDVAVDSTGIIYLSTAARVGGMVSDNAITKYGSSGNNIGVFKTFSSGPRFMAFDLDDNLYVTTTTESGLNNVFKINREGEVEESWFVPNAYGVAVE